MDQAVSVDQFLKLYFEMSVAKPVDLGKLYQEGSRLNFEGEKIRDRESILAQLTSHPFARCKHSIMTVDYNASDNDGGLLVFVNGALDFVQQDGEGHALNFSQGCSLAIQFAKGFFGTFDANRGGLGELYGEDSVLTFEGQKFRGRADISAHINSLPFRQCQHSIKTVDGQPAGPSCGVLVLVKGLFEFVQLNAPVDPEAVLSTPLDNVDVATTWAGVAQYMKTE